MAILGKGLQIVVTGTGRCGTKFTSRVLESVGLTVKHQFIFRPGRGGPGSPEVLPELKDVVTIDDIRHRVSAYKASEWGPQAETSWLAAPYLNLPEMQDVVKVHLVRHPKKVIDSLVKVQVFERRDRYGLYVDFAYYWVPEMHYERTPKERAALFYLCWNRMIEPHTDIFWNVEKDARGLLDLLGLEHEGRDVFDDTSYNGRLGPDVDTRLGDLRPGLRAELREMAGRYGYEWDTLTPALSQRERGL